MTERRQRTFRLAASYLTVIVVMSLLFSAIIYGVTVSQFNRPLPPPGSRQQLTIPADAQRRIDARDDQTRQSIIISLVFLNLSVLLAGGWVSYYLARRTLHPIEVAMDAQTQFISDASHELRTPLTALRITNEVALRKSHLDDAKARSILSKNSLEIDKLHTLTETLLTLTIADQQILALQPIKLIEVVDDTLATMVAAAAAKQIEVSRDIPDITVTANPVGLTQAVTILVDNAIKYAPPGSAVRLVATVDKHRALLTVSDTGPGIDEADQAHIFDRFYRADSARGRSQSGGHGLGLAIARALCARQNIGLRLATSSKQGSEFELAIPKA